MVTVLSDLSGLIDLMSVTLLIACCFLLYSAHKSFKSGDVSVITACLLIALLATFGLRFVAMVDVQIFKIQNIAFFRACFAFIASLAFLFFSVKFFEFARQYGFAARNVKKSLSDRKIVKAFGGDEE